MNITILGKKSLTDKTTSQLPIYGLAAVASMKNGNYDNALLYADEMMRHGGAVQRYTATNILARIYAQRGDVKNASRYLGLFEHYADSVDRKIAMHSLTHKHAKHHFIQMYGQYQTLKAHDTNKRLVIIFLATVIAIGAWLAVAVYRRSRREAKARLLRYKALLAKMRQQTEDIDMAKQRKQMDETVNRHIVESRIYAKLIARATNGEAMKEEEWLELDELVGSLLPSFKSSLYGIGSISLQDYRLCLLLRIGNFNGTETASLLGRDKSTISKAKKKLQERFLGNSAGTMKLDAFIKSL